jgi:hypothetical protein
VIGPPVGWRRAVIGSAHNRGGEESADRIYHHFANPSWRKRTVNGPINHCDIMVQLTNGGGEILGIDVESTRD